LPKGANGRPAGTRHGLARVLSKRGLCSRREAALWIAAGRVSVGGKIVRDPEFPVRERDAVTVDDQSVGSAPRIYIALNKPRGLVTTASDEQGRDTVYRCLQDAGLPWLAPVGRLDKASEGLLLLANDPAWAARITDPGSGPDKTYHVQVDRIPTPDTLAAMEQGVRLENGEVLRASAVKLLRTGQRNAWLEIVLEEGRNRQSRRLLQSLDIGVLRLVRVAIGGVALGTLAKGAWRPLSADEVKSLAAPGG